jgi:L-ascorbate metabolism protein UlaG (beta-lactamase superfamily)
MKLRWCGHAAFLVTSKEGVTIITDPYEPGGYDGALRYGPIEEPVDIAVVTHDHADHNHVEGLKGNPTVIRGEGTHEAQGITFEGLGVYHDSTKGSERGENTIYCFAVDGLRICHAGDLGHPLSDKDVETIRPVDLLLVPVGGFFTIDGTEAAEVVHRLKPKVVIPMHFKTSKCDFPIAGVEEFTRGKGNVEELDASEVEITRETLPSETAIRVLKHAL